MLYTELVLTRLFVSTPHHARVFSIPLAVAGTRSPQLQNLRILVHRAARSHCAADGAADVDFCSTITALLPCRLQMNNRERGHVR